MSDIGSDIPPAALTIRSLSAPQAHIERALPAVSDVGVLETDDQRAEFRQREPERNLPPEHTAFGAITVGPDRPLAGDNEHDTRFIGLSLLQEAQQCRVGSALRHAMQIDPISDRLAAAGDAPAQSPAEW